MSRTSLGTTQEPLARTDTPEPDGRRRKKVRWNSDGIVEGDKQDDSEESSYDCKVRSPCPFMSTFLCHLTPTRPRLSHRFVLPPRTRRKAIVRIYAPPISHTMTLKGTNWRRILQPSEFSNLRS